MRTNHYFVDTDKNRIEFLDLRYYLGDDGKWYPSATTILDCYPKGAAYFEWVKKFGDLSDDIRDAAAEKGSTVHKLTELYDAGEEVTMMSPEGRPLYKQIEWAQFERYVQFINRFNPDIIENELNMISPHLGFGGTLDRIMGINGKKLLVDIKTSNQVYNHYFLQLASYVKLYEEQKGEKLDGAAILWLNAKTRTEGKKGDIQGIGWQLIMPTRELDYYWGLFQATQALWTEENETVKPRNLSYSLTHKR